MDDTSATTSIAAPPESPQQSQPPTSDASATPDSAGFGSRGRIRRRARFLRKARELAYRDLGGLVFNLHRFGQRNDPLVLAKLGTLSRIDSELRALEANLSERQPVTVLREAGITACPRCAAIHSGEDRFCPNCGLPLSRNVDLPIAGPPAATPVPAPAPATASTSPAPAPAPPPAQGAPPAATPPPATGAPSAPGAGRSPGSTPSPAPAPVLGGSQPPPEPATQPFPAQSAGGEDQPTEIIRPPAAKP